MKEVYQPKKFEEHDFKEYDTGIDGTIFAVSHWNKDLQDDAIADDEVFSYVKYSQVAKKPVLCHQIDFSLNDSFVMPRCLDMPIKMAGQHLYFLPEEWGELLPLVKQVASFEHAHNPSWKDYYAYLTFDISEVKAGDQQRHGGLHVDGFQGERINPKTKINRSYVMTSNGGTRFYPQSFVVVDPEKYNVFQGFDLQAKEYELAEENQVYLMDAYTVHESGVADRDGLRMFVRLSYDLKEFDRLGNTHNSMFTYRWDMVTRNAHELVSTPSLNNVEESPYQ